MLYFLESFTCDIDRNHSKSFRLHAIYSQKREKLYVQKLSVQAGNERSSSHQGLHFFKSPTRDD